jgi:hypothetical protein
MTDRPWPQALDFEHVNAEHFLVRYHPINNATDFDAATEARKAEFRIGEDGKVKEIGLEFEDTLDEMIWFGKVG